MEIAEQWQREWTGTAEYGKVTEGGVTRRIARAMEVLNASKPGARVRVLRAAYHSSAAPGVPASSYMLHSSRRVISSGFNYTEPPSLPSLPAKPLEISSTPLDSSPDFNSESENYKVTEPDDLDISEPSKWRGSTGGSTIRMPSEESSSTDNASIIDLDSRTGKNLNRKYSYDSENSDIQWNKGNPSISPILSAPVALNTLKYKSLLNGSNDWHNRRKSYSFEDMVPSKESMLCGNDTIAMESSTDSGICKSSEIVNDHTTDIIFLSRQETKINKSHDQTFKDWLSKNRKNSFYNGTKFKTYMEHDIVIEEPDQNNITLQSTGKMSISLPITIETDNNYQYKKAQRKDDGHRKIKKVEFCKTELHFAAETGKVNIIATDEKPPPSNDFRKRRSAFLPLHDMPEKPITLFGDKINEMPEYSQIKDILNHSYSEITETDENTAATKSILKNKIPKPKPYLLGENMTFGPPNDLTSEDRLKNETPALTAVTLINKQLQLQRRYSDDITSSLTNDIDRLIHKGNDGRINENDPTKDASFNTSEYVFTTKSQRSIKEMNDLDHVNSIKNRFHGLEKSPIQRRSKTRELRETDLTYFGVDLGEKEKSNEIKGSEYNLSSDDSVVENIFQSVKLIQKIANSVCSSETELEDVPEYQNIPVCMKNVPVPTPRLRSKYDDKPIEIKELRNLKPIVEQEDDDNFNSNRTTRKSRVSRQETIMVTSNRSISEPPKRYRYNSLAKPHGQHNQPSRCTKNHIKEEIIKNKAVNQINKTKIIDGNGRQNPLETIPFYVNLSKDNKITENLPRKESTPQRSLQRESQSKTSEKRDNLKHHNKNLQSGKIIKTSRHNDSESDSLKRKERSHNKQPMEKVEAITKTTNHERKIDSVICSQNSNKSTSNKHNNENKIANKKESAHNSGTSKNHSTYAKSEKTLTREEDSTKDIKERNVRNVNSNNNLDSNRRSSKENTYTRKEDNIEYNKKISVHSLNSTQIKLNDINTKNKELNAKLNTHRTRKNEYVINYDDKNGIVSSVCKIKQGPAGTSRKKTVSKEILDENAKEHPLRYKALNKIALLQLADHPKSRNGLSYADRKWKTKIHVQKSCQLL